MNRKEWRFHYSAYDLKNMAAIKCDRHRERMQWWMNKKAEVMEAIKASGIEVTESIAAGYGNTSAGGYAAITIDPELQRQLLECQQRIASHKSKMDEYHGWYQIMDKSVEKSVGSFDLDYEDFLFFFGD